MFTNLLQSSKVTGFPFTAQTMSIRKLFLWLLLLSFFTISTQPAHDPDLWWHLRTGEYILQAGIPHQDPPFSFTTTGQPWITHEWLSEVFMFSVYQMGGLSGLSLLFGMLVAIAFGLLYWSSPGRPYIAGFISLWGLIASIPFINARPQMFNLLLGATFIYLVERYKAKRLSKGWLWVLPLLTMVWVNLHSGFLFGIVILGVYVIGGGLQIIFSGADVEGLGWEQIRYLGRVTAVSALTTLINPNGYQLWIYPFLTLGSQAMQVTISEWQSPNFHNLISWAFGIMLLGGGLTILLSHEKPTWTEMIFFLGAGAAGLQSVRHIPLFVVVTVPLLSRHLLGTVKKSRAFPLLSGSLPEKKLPPLLNRVNWTLAILAVILVIVQVERGLSKADELIAAKFPVTAVDYLEQEGLTQARIYNEYVWGGYLIWRGVPTFIDGRADLYGDDFIFYYLKTYFLEEDWQKPLEDFDIAYVLVKQTGSLSTLLETSPRWKSVYHDEVAVIYGRVAR